MLATDLHFVVIHHFFQLENAEPESFCNFVSMSISKYEIAPEISAGTTAPEKSNNLQVQIICHGKSVKSVLRKNSTYDCVTCFLCWENVLKHFLIVL